MNDISYLWPLPKTVADVDRLISVKETTADGTGSFLPAADFDRLLTTAQSVELQGASGVRKIRFPAPFQAAFQQPETWKVVAFRVDPSAPGTEAKTLQIFGSQPQLRLIVQPVTVQNGTFKVHDLTMHLVFDFTSRILPPAPGSKIPQFVPDRERFGAVLADLLELKNFLKAAGVETSGDLGIHPGFQQQVPGFDDRVKAFLKKHVHPGRLNATAFMGLDLAEPWIFFSMARRNGELVRVGHPSLGTEKAQMLSFRDFPRVHPVPANSTFTTRGVSTAVLFGDLSGAPFSPTNLLFPGDAELGELKSQDIPDLIASPTHSHFFKTDCISCHTESARRVFLSLPENTPFTYQRAEGISGVNPDRLPGDTWNVRNFGWGLEGFIQFKETVTMRTANEAAESAAFINREYFGIIGAGPTNPAVAVNQTPAQPANVANPLTLVMAIKSEEDFQALKELIEGMQKLPPDQNPIVQALNRIGNVHFARFVFIGKDKLAVITTYDGDFDRYILLFTEEIGDIFDQLLKHVKDAPPTPVKDHPDEFLQFVKKYDLTSIGPLYSAYPNLDVPAIKALQNKPSQPE